MVKKAKDLLLQQVLNLEIGIGEACGQGAFKNAKYVSDLQTSINVLRAYIESVPVEEQKPILQAGTNGKA